MRFLSALVFTILGTSLVCAQLATADGLSAKTIQPDGRTKSVIYDYLSRLQERYKTQLPEKKAFEVLRGLGFQSIDQVASVQIGEGFPVYVLRLDRLKSYKEKTHPWPLLIETEALIYPLTVGHDLSKVAISSVTITTRQRTGSSISPRVVEIGNSELIRLLMEASKLQEVQHCGRPSDCFAISVPALSLYLFGYRNTLSDEFKVIVLNRVHGHVKASDLKTAEVVIDELSNEARQGTYDRPKFSSPPNKHKLKPSELTEGGEDAVIN